MGLAGIAVVVAIPSSSEVNASASIMANVAVNGSRHF